MCICSQYIFDRTAVLNGMSGRDFALSYINATYDRIRPMETVDSLLRKVVQGSQLDAVESLLFDNTCTETDYFAVTTECEAFADGATQEGASALISHYLTNIRLIIEDDGYSTDDAEKKQAMINSQLFYENCTVAGVRKDRHIDREADQADNEQG